MKILLFLSILFFSANLLAETYYLSISESVKIPIPSSGQVRAQRKGIVQIKDLGSSLLLVGKKIGETTIIAGNTSHLIHVIKKPNYESLQQLKAWLKNKRGPEVKVVKGEVVITGRLLHPLDFFELPLFTNQASHFSLQMQYEPAARVAIEHRIKKLLSQNNLTAGELSFSPTLSLRLPARLKKQKARYGKILNPLGVPIVFDQGSLTDQPMIEIKVHIAHIKKTFFRHWGVDWPTEVGATLVPGQNPRLSEFSLALQGIESQGWGKVLATPLLVTESNKEATFHSGGEFPVRISTQFNNTVQWKKYGLSLKVKPIANSQGHLQIDIDLELSSLDQAAGLDDVPALNRSHIQTFVNMKQPRPFLLSGFMEQVQNDNSSGLPWLKQIPILSPLFSTGQIYNRDFELVFILEPKFYGE